VNDSKLRSNLKTFVPPNVKISGKPEKVLVGQLVDALLEITAKRSEYIDPVSLERLPHLLNNFKAFSLLDYVSGRQLVQDVPVSRISMCISSWLRSFLSRCPDEKAILAHFALDAAIFIGGHMNGARVFYANDEQGLGWRLEPMCAGTFRDLDDRYYDDWREKRFKS
jgi:hypothetical protein